MMIPGENLEDLLVSATEGTLSAAERGKLNQLLEQNPEVIDAVVRFLMDDDLLRTELNVLDNELSIEKQLPMLSTGEKPRPITKWWLGAAAALVTMFLLGKWQGGPPAESGKIADDRRTEKQNETGPVARLTRGYGLSFADLEFEIGDYRIEEGTAELLFRNGVEVILDAPADFTIESEMKMTLREGRVRARVPEQAIGFTINAPDLDIVDLGTEFGVYVERDKRTEIHVFSGEVELHEKNGSPSDTRVIKEGIAENWVDGKVSKFLQQPDTTAFSSSSEIGFKRWKLHQKMLLQDPNLLLCWDFQGGHDHSQVVADRKGNQRYQGYIRGAKRVNGRWANKKALLFDSPDDRVNLDISEELYEFTFSSWIKVDSFQSPIVALLNSNGLLPRSVHWQLRDRGGLRVSSHKVFYGSSNHSYIKPGEWTHVALSYHAEKRRLRAYVDGDVVMEWESATNDPVVLGRANLGYWAVPTFWPRKRDFKGRIGELLIFNNEKSPSELQAIYESGKP